MLEQLAQPGHGGQAGVAVLLKSLGTLQ